MLTTTITDSIWKGEQDTELSAITAAVKERRKTIDRHVGTQLKPGQVITLNDRIRPLRLAGQKAKIIRVNQTTATIKLVEPDDRFKGEVRCPISFITI